MNVTVHHDKNFNVYHGMALEDIISEIYESIPQLAAVVDNRRLELFPSVASLPPRLRFQHKEGIRYYFHSELTSQRYCVFGANNARIFYPALEEDSITTREEPACTIILRDNKVEHKFVIPARSYLIRSITVGDKSSH